MLSPQKEMIVCVDGSLYGRVVTEYAVWISKRSGIRVRALYVSELGQFDVTTAGNFSGMLGVQSYVAISEQLKVLENNKAKAIQEFVEKSFADAGIAGNLVFEHRVGSLADTVAEMEKQNPEIQVIIIGKRGENCNFAKGFLGSNLERIVRQTKLPCFIVNRKFIEPNKMLFAYDGGISAQKLLKFIIDHKEFFNHEIHVITVAKVGKEEEASKCLMEAENALRGMPTPVKFQILSGSRADAIQNYANTNGITLIMMGAYGHSRIRDFIIGSTTTEVVRRCLVPFWLYH